MAFQPDYRHFTSVIWMRWASTPNTRMKMPSLRLTAEIPAFSAVFAAALNCSTKRAKRDVRRKPLERDRAKIPVKQRVRWLLWGFFCLASCVTRKPTVDIEKGEAMKKNVHIVVAEETPPVLHAAEELAAFLSTMTGQNIPVGHERSGGVNLFVGPMAAKMADPTFDTLDLGHEGIVLRSVGDDLILAGGHPRGTLYAVYTFLEQYGGCRWWTDKTSSIPTNPDFAIPRGLHLRYAPPLEYRWSFWTHINKNADFAARNKVNGPDGLRDPKYGGRMSHGGVHTFYRLIPPAKWFQEHPEWFSEIDGKRTHDNAQLCLSNEAMRRELVKELQETIRRNPEPPVYSVSQNDCRGYCTCAACKALAEQYGGQSGAMIWFVNQVAEAIEKEHGDVSISTLAYQYTRVAPINIRPRKNVIVQLCSIECSFSVPLDHERNQAFKNDIAAWSKTADRLYVWDYVTNFRHHILPHPNLRVLGPNVRFLTAHNVKGIFEQGAYTTLGAEFAELRGWVLAKLLWDPSLNDKELIREFVEGYYGKRAAPHILRYIDHMEDAVAASGDPLGCFSENTAAFLSFENLRAGWKHLAAAEAAVRRYPELLSRVQAAQLPVLYAFLMRWDTLKGRAKQIGAAWPLAADIRDVHETFMRIARREGVTRLNEWEEGFGALDKAVKNAAPRTE